MADPRRKSTVREAFSSSLQSQKRKIVGKLRGRYLFRAAIRLVIEYLDWISDDADTEQIGDNVTANVKFAQRKKPGEREELTIKDRSILFIPPAKRTEEDVAYIECMLRDLRAFKRYPKDVRDSLAADCRYQFVPAGRTVIKQEHIATFMYYIVKGQLQIIRKISDSLTGEEQEIEAGTLEPGNMFGEIALMHKVPRSATVVSKTNVDLLLISRKSFDLFLRSLLLEEWDTLQDALLNFNYFKGWSDETMRECCIVSKIVSFKPNEILLGDGKGKVHYVYFILSGECRLIEHMLIEKNRVDKKVKYKLYEAQPEDKNPRQRIGRSKKINLSDDNLPTLILESATLINIAENMEQKEESTAVDYIKMLSTKKPSNQIAMDRISVVTVTLQDVLNQWHEITDVVEMLMKQPSTASLRNYPKNVQTVFMQICIFYRGACFGLGEQMKNRRVVSTMNTKCLLIPRFWLTQHNRANIWERVKHFMNTKFPNNKQLLDRYTENRAWAKHKKEYAKKVVRNGRQLPNDTKLYDVPYSLRINENIVEE